MKMWAIKHKDRFFAVHLDKPIAVLYAKHLNNIWSDKKEYIVVPVLVTEITVENKKKK